MSQNAVIERALVIARSGEVESVLKLRRRLEKEFAIGEVSALFDGKAIRSSLKKAIREAATKPEIDPRTKDRA